MSPSAVGLGPGGKISSRRQECCWLLAGKWELLPWLPATSRMTGEYNLTMTLQVRPVKNTLSSPFAVRIPRGQEFKSQGTKRRQAGGSWFRYLLVGEVD